MSRTVIVKANDLEKSIEAKSILVSKLKILYWLLLMVWNIDINFYKIKKKDIYVFLFYPFQAKNTPTSAKQVVR